MAHVRTRWFGLLFFLAACSGAGAAGTEPQGPWSCNGGDDNTGSEGERCDSHRFCTEGTFGINCERLDSSGRYRCECHGSTLPISFETKGESCETIRSTEFLNQRCGFHLPPQ